MVSNEARGAAAMYSSSHRPRAVAVTVVARFTGSGNHCELYPLLVEALNDTHDAVPEAA